MSGIVDTLEQIIETATESLGFQLWGFQYNSNGNQSVLRVFIDSADAGKEGSKGVGVDDCAQVSRQLSAVLDVEDPIAGHYVLEVSSPGLDRPLFKLDQYEAYIGSEIKIKLLRAVEKQRKFKAELLLVDSEQDEIEIAHKGERLRLALSNIDKANLVVKV